MTCISSITVTPSAVTLKKGEWYYNASAVACPADADCKCVRWHSDNTSVATVNATSGYIYAKAAGTAKIYACSTDGSGKSDHITVIVLDTVTVCSVTLNTNSICLEKDQCCTLSATVCPVNASNKSLYWTSNNPNVANVDGGVVCALSGGTATIKAIAADGTGVFDTCVVTVTEDVLVSSITLDNQSLTMNVGQSQYLHATVCPENATNKNVTWTSSNTSVATVNPNSGLVLAQNAGSATIYANALDGSGKIAHCSVIVNSVPIECIQICPECLTFDVGESALLEATLFPANASNKGLAWTSSNIDVAEVDIYGRVTAKAAGNTTICASAQDGSGKSACCSVTVNPVLVNSIEISPDSATLYVYESVNLTATPLPENASNKSITWRSSNNAVASVDENGRVTANSHGSAYIFAEAQDGSGTIASRLVTVLITNRITSFSMSPQSITIGAGESFSFDITIEPIDNHERVVWSSRSERIATVNSGGRVTALNRSGTTTIYARRYDGSLLGSCKVTVDARPKVTVRKDGDHFTITFPQTDDEAAAVWKSIGCDMSLPENRPKPSEIEYDLLPEHMKRYLFNIDQKYTIGQIALLYLFDPLGIEYYMKNDACDGMSLLESLYFKDNVYKAIFTDTVNGKFNFKIVDGQVVYFLNTPDPSVRATHYTNAEVLFGSHAIIDWSNFWETIFREVFANIPVVSQIISGVELCQSLFFAGSIEDAVSGAASMFLDTYVDVAGNDFDEWLFGWPMTLMTAIQTVSEAVEGSVTLKVPNDITIYNKINQNTTYRVDFADEDVVLSMGDIISKISTT